MSTPNRLQVINKIGRYRILAEEPIAEIVFEDLENLILESSREGRARDLEGRGVITTGVVRGLGAVVLKQYRRGGWLRAVNESTYLGLFSHRLETEYRMLREVSKLDIPVPTPYCLAVTGTIFQSAWLFMEEIPHAQTLSSLCRGFNHSASREEYHLPSQAIQSLAHSVVRLIENRIWHIDLHPGNVLVSSTGKSTLIDFDKALYFSGRRNDLRDRYITRWRRASIKHRLPEFLSEEFCAYVRKNFDAAI